jgi:hypothetical protein
MKRPVRREKDNLTSQEMPTDNNTPGTCALFSSPDFKFGISSRETLKMLVL